MAVADLMSRPRLRLSHRIALAMVISILAVQCLVILQIMFYASPRVDLVSMRWLAAETASAAGKVFDAAAGDRRSIAAELTHSGPMTVDWNPVAPSWVFEGPSSQFVAGLETIVKRAIGGNVKRVEIAFFRSAYLLPTRALEIQALPQAAELDPKLKLADAEEPDIVVAGRLRVAVQGGDGSWIVAAPGSMNEPQLPALRPLLSLLGGGIIIALLSALTARWLLRPLDRLTVSAERIGIGRAPVPISESGLHEFTPIAAALNRTQDRLFRFIADRTQMLAAISHDLRTSITRLKLLADDLEDDRRRGEIETELDDMHQMLESTLVFAGADARAEPTQQTDFASMLISLCDAASDAGAQTTYEGPDHLNLNCQPVAMKRAMRNLIDNACKYGVTARVTLRSHDRNITARISDDGPGIPADRFEEAFAPYRRLDPSRNRNRGGIGLGLTIARDAIQANGGRIELHNRPEGGLDVVVEFPNH